MNTLNISQIAHSYPGGTEVLSKINLSANQGQVVGIFGENGVGKTTLLKLLAGLLKPTNGNIEWQETGIVTKEYPSKLTKICYLGCNTEGLIHHLQVRENLEFWARQYSVPLNLENAPPQITALLNKFTKELSTGMKQMIDLYRCTILNPQILLLDEPFRSLDAGKKQLGATWIISHAKTSITLVTGHQSDQLRDLCHELYELKNGQLYFSI